VRAIAAATAVLAAVAAAGALAGVHPRLLLDRRRVESLRPALETTHRFLWERYEQDLPRMVAVATQPFFDKTFSVLPEDGSSLEGYAYAGYGGEYLLLYALLARVLFGKDETIRPWVRHFPDYLLHGLLPRRTADEWAMTFGDSPRRGWSSTAHHLFTLAWLYGDGRAQWMAREKRQLLFVKPDVLVVADEVGLREEGVVHDFMPETLKTTGGLRHASNGYVVGPEGETFLLFEGEPGTYRIAAVYLDNVPGAGRYSFGADGRTVHSWTSRNEDRDDHLIAVSDAVALRRGSRVAFRGASMPPGTRLTKLSVFSDSVKAPRGADWLLHLDPKSEVRETRDGLEAAFGGAVLELHRLLPRDASLSWGRHAVARPEVEPFTFRETTRVVLRPPFSGREAHLLTLLRARAAGAPALANVQATREGDRLRIAFDGADGRTAIDWDLAGRQVALERSRAGRHLLRTDQTIAHEGRVVKGLALPDSVLRRLFRDNAVRFVAGVEALR